MPEPITFRPRGGEILAWSAFALCGAALVFIAVTDGVESLVVWAWPIVLIAWIAWLLYARPSVTVDGGFIEIDNPFRVHRIPWDDIDEVDTRYALTIMTRSTRKIRAWAAPAPSARQALSTQREQVAHATGDGDTRRPADAEGTASGDAAGLIRRRLADHRRNGVKAPGVTRTDVHVALIAVTVVLVVATAVSLGSPHS